ncbi:hypothetical protein ANO14919_082810 [Xylariales sp. No.14919]|nr:hypothetical protein ANO14919_082810 [Xylariales sp. No.14919]
MEKLDCVVIGAGWNGLAAAKQLTCTQPSRAIAILERESSIGGTWADHRLYGGLKSNNLLGTFEYPDFPMTSDKFDVKEGEHISGYAINAYLKAYAQSFGIAEFVRLQTVVLTAEHQDTEEGGWVLTVKSSGSDTSVQIFARRLIVATGILSEPFLPRFKGQDTFGGMIFHTRDFPQIVSKGVGEVKAVTILGSGKSSWDAVYHYATAGVKVNWVIRSTGYGPVWMSPPFVTPFKRWIEKLANTRFLTWFSPCIWGSADGYDGIRKFYHATALGRFLVNQFWKILGNDVMQLNKYDSHPKTAKLKPWLDVMYVGGSFSILNYEKDFFELIKSDNNLVDIHIGEITSLSPGRVHLGDGTILESDAFILNTGWGHVPSVKFLPEGIENELGIPHALETASPSSEPGLGSQTSLLERADDEILRRFPILKTLRVWNKSFTPLPDHDPSKLTPYMLYRFLVPASPRFLRLRDTAFIGHQSNLSTVITSHITALWISAYFSGQLARDPSAAIANPEATKQLQYETVLHNRFGKWRYPADWGNRAPNFNFDAIPYFDLLQHDLGLSPYRKGGMLAEMTDPYGPEDYRNITEEWLEARNGDRLTQNNFR